MTLLGSIGFSAPLALLGLLALPAIWWLLRATPPRPREEVFPPTRLLLDIARHEETPARSPWWLTALRLLLVTVVAGSLRHADDIVSAAEARAFSVERARPLPITCRRRDLAVTGVLAAVAVAICLVG